MNNRFDVSFSKFQENNPNYKQKDKDRKDNVLKKIDESISFGICQEDINVIVENCRRINDKNPNQYFDNIISDLESKFVYSLDDIYIIEDLSKIKRFLNRSK